MATKSQRGKPAMYNLDRFSEEAIEQLATDAHEEQGVQEVHDVHDTMEGYTPTIEFGATQGKKGHKAPRINMAFSPENHEWIKKRSRQLGISATEFVNAILTRERTKG